MWGGGGGSVHTFGGSGGCTLVGERVNAFVCLCIFNGICVQIRGQLSEVRSLSTLGSGGGIQVLRFDVARETSCLSLSR